VLVLFLSVSIAGICGMWGVSVLSLGCAISCVLAVSGFCAVFCLGVFDDCGGCCGFCVLCRLVGGDLSSAEARSSAVGVGCQFIGCSPSSRGSCGDGSAEGIGLSVSLVRGVLVGSVQLSLSVSLVFGDSIRESVPLVGLPVRLAFLGFLFGGCLLLDLCLVCFPFWLLVSLFFSRLLVCAFLSASVARWSRVWIVSLSWSERALYCLIRRSFSWVMLMCLVMLAWSSRISLQCFSWEWEVKWCSAWARLWYTVCIVSCSVMVGW